MKNGLFFLILFSAIITLNNCSKSSIHLADINAIFRSRNVIISFTDNLPRLILKVENFTFFYDGNSMLVLTRFIIKRFKGLLTIFIYKKTKSKLFIFGIFFSIVHLFTINEYYHIPFWFFLVFCHYTYKFYEIQPHYTNLQFREIH